MSVCHMNNARDVHGYVVGHFEKGIQFAVALSVLLTSFISSFGVAQTTLGIPPFATIDQHQYESIDLADLGTMLAIPVRSKPGALPFTLTLQQQRTIMKDPNQNVWDLWGTWMSGQISSRSIAKAHPTVYQSMGLCPDGTVSQAQEAWVVVDWANTQHPMPSSFWADTHGCFQSSATATPLDQSGYTVTLNSAPPNGVTYTIYDRDGNLIGHSSTVDSITDPWGHSISATTTTSGSTSTVVYGDTLGTTAATATLTSSTNGVDTYSYTDSTGAQQSYTVHWTNYYWKTNFGCHSINGSYPSDNSNSTATPFPTSVTLADGSTMTFTYEQTPGSSSAYTTGRLASLTLPSGGLITYAYSGGDSGKGLNCVDGTTATLTRTTPDGIWTYSHTPPASSGGNSTTVVTDAASNQTVLTFSGLFLVNKKVYSGPQSTGQLLLTKIISYNNNQQPVTYPITQQRIETHLPGKTPYSYVVSTLDSSFGNVLSRLSYDFSGALLSDEEYSYAVPCGSAEFITKEQIKDASGNIAAETDLTNPDCAGHPLNVQSLTGFVGGTPQYLTTQYHYQAGQVQDIYPPSGNDIYYYYNACNGLLPSSASNGATTKTANLWTYYSWDCNGGVLNSVTDANQQATTYAHGDPLWRLTSSTDPLVNTTTYSYGPGGTSSSASQSFGSSIVSTTTTTDSMGRPYVKQTLQGPGLGSYDTVMNAYAPANGYNYTSLPCSSTLGSGCAYVRVCQSQCYYYLPAGVYTYFDALGRTTSVQDAGGGTISLSYTQNDLYKSLSPVPAGEHIKATQNEYDGLGRLISVCEVNTASDATNCGQSVAMTGYLTTYSYDAAGRLSKVTEGQQVRTFTYDLAGRITSETNPESGTTQYFWDNAPSTPGVACSAGANGQLIKKYDANGNTTCYQYDVNNRIAAMIYSGPNSSGVNKYFVYDGATVNGVTVANAVGRVAEAYTATCQTCTKITDIAFSYSPRGEITDTWELTPNSGGYYHPTASYWANGALKNLWISSLPSISYGLDGEGRTSTVSASSGQNPVSSTSYNTASLVTGVTFGSGDSDSFTFDPNTNRMTKYAFTVNGSSETGAMTWNPNGTVATLAITDPFNSADNQTCSYLYDDLGRVGTPPGSTAASINCGSAWSQTVSYDRYGNVTKSGSISWQPGYNAANNRYLQAGSTYDAKGNLLNDTFHAYTWDVEARPLAIDNNTLTYDALGRMVEQNISGTHYEIVYTPMGTKLGTFKGSTIQQLYVPLPGGSSAEYLSWGLSHYRHPDWLGSDRLESSSNTSTHQILDNNAYAPFGEPYAQTGNGEISFTGQNKDTTWLQYDFLARQYDPKQGRWISPDPLSIGAADLGDPQSWNAYAYAGNNPLVFADPDGRDFGDLGDSLDSLSFDLSITAPIIGDDQIVTGICVPNPCEALQTSQGDSSGGMSASEYLTEMGSIDFQMDQYDLQQSGLAQMGIGHSGDFGGWTPIQTTLDLAGMIPGPIGTIANVGSAGISLFQGHYGQAALSLAFAVPVVGGVLEIGKAAEVAEEGYSTFSAFKKVYGAAEEGKQWHHIVEQTSTNLERFGAEAIHTPNNLIQVSKDAHIGKDSISAFYSSKQSFSEGMTVRQWLATKSFEEQREFGQQVLRERGIIP